MSAGVTWVSRVGWALALPAELRIQQLDTAVADAGTIALTVVTCDHRAAAFGDQLTGYLATALAPRWALSSAGAGLPANSVLVRACHQVRFDASGALPLRRHVTDVYLLPHARQRGVVVKIVPATAYTSAHRSVALTRWLQTQGFPCTTTEDVEQPVQVDDQCVTFWRYFDQRGRAAPGAGALGSLLRELYCCCP